jgi:hypothetical protein
MHRSRFLQNGLNENAARRHDEAISSFRYFAKGSFILRRSRTPYRQQERAAFFRNDKNDGRLRRRPSN